jgi:hypothetical protein
MKNLFGKIFGDRGYISSSLFEMLLDNGIHPVTGIKSNMKNRLMCLRDHILLRKRSVIETINDGLKNICLIEHSRHRSLHNFIMNLIAAVGACCFFEKKTSILFDREKPAGQLEPFLLISRLFSSLNHILQPTVWRMEYAYFYPISLFPYNALSRTQVK